MKTKSLLSSVAVLATMVGIGMAAQTKTVNENFPLINNAGLIDDNGNDSGLLKVTDSRTAAASNNDGKTPMAAETSTIPWQLTVTLGDFS